MQKSRVWDKIKVHGSKVVVFVAFCDVLDRDLLSAARPMLALNRNFAYEGH
jgi:hypothetical protein